MYGWPGINSGTSITLSKLNSFSGNCTGSVFPPALSGVSLKEGGGVGDDRNGASLVLLLTALAGFGFEAGLSCENLMEEEKMKIKKKVGLTTHLPHLSSM